MVHMLMNLRRHATLLDAEVYYSIVVTLLLLTCYCRSGADKVSYESDAVEVVKACYAAGC